MKEPDAERSKSAAGGNAEIFVVDDEAMLLELALVILEPSGYRIKTFRSPEAALRAFTEAQPPPALIITDYAMHSMNGLELIEACRRIEPRQKALMLSGTVGPDVYYNAPSRPDRFLGKPYQAKDLLEAVKAVLAD
jgi:CheY-like chemotaxis protein